MVFPNYTTSNDSFAYEGVAMKTCLQVSMKKSVDEFEQG